jgi:uncharacterized protein YlzI (FlbEa/FlbD family)
MPIGEKEILKLIFAYLENNLSDSERKEIEHKLKTDKQFQLLFKQYIEVYRNYKQLGLVKTIDKNLAWEKTISNLSTPLTKGIKLNTRKKTRFKKYLHIYAITFTILSLTFALNLIFNTQNIESLEIKKEAVTITLSNGKKQILDLSSETKVLDKNGEVLVYQKGNTVSYSKETSQKTLEYNTINVPYGKHISLLLSDSTIVFLNSGTSLRYPQKFLANLSSREVFLSGEAYFQVKKDSLKPFIVHSDKINVNVFGTEFDIRAYPEDEFSQVVLIEGSVALSDKLDKRSVKLKPGEMGHYHHKTNKIKTEQVFVKNYVGWIDGELVYRNVTLDFILKSLERNFNVEIINNSDILKDEKLNVNFGNDSLPKILKHLKDDFNLNYKIKNNKIVIK